MEPIFIFSILFLQCNSQYLNGISSNIFEHKQSIPRVVVVGGGVAGITAAARLHNSAFDVTLLEATDRIGGRTHTMKLDGQHIEVGGEWVHGEKGNSIYQLVNPLGLLKNNQIKPNHSHEFGNEFGFQNGAVLNSTMWDTLKELLERLWSDLDLEDWIPELSKDVISMGDFARLIVNRINEVQPIHSDNLTMEAIYDWAHRATNAEAAADNWFDLSASDDYETPEGFANVPWMPQYSYSSLHQLILTGSVTVDGIYDLPKWIKLNAEVTRIDYLPQSDIVNVTTNDGTVYTAEHVIFTPSLGVLKANHKQLFQPQLNERKRLAIEYWIRFRNKIRMEFEEPWWPEDYKGRFLLWNDHDYSNASLNYWRPDITEEELLKEYDGLPLWTRSILNIFNVDSGSAPKIMRVWWSGLPSRFLEEMDPVYLQQTVMAVVHKFLDATFPNITEPIRTYQSKWATNPFTKGTYSYRTMAAEENDVWAKDLAEPILHPVTKKPLVCFAGEATHSNYYSTVHGAYDTGIREFVRILFWKYGK